ncbi:MAG: peptidylprolyl isomerase [Gemmatimonadota bacterium]|nr:peptidylprolyl isomerase [Gemmatimonadota bacterium]
MARGSLLLALAALVWAVAPASAQRALPEDRIMAVVGDRLLLQSEWESQTAVLASQMQAPPGSPEFAEIARETFDQMIRDLVIVAVAERDTAIGIDPGVVEEEAEAEIERVRARFPSEEVFREQLRQSQWGSLAAYRADIIERKRRELLGQALIERRRGGIGAAPVSDEEVRAYWEQNRERFAERPEMVRFEEISVRVRPGESAREEALEEAERVLEEIREGRPFGAAAREVSEDTLTASRGGDLGWFPRGRMVPSFEEAAFGARRGEIVGPVETPFGYHLIQVLDKREDEVRARHVLIGFDTTAEDRARARERAERVRDLVTGGADVDSLQAEFGPSDSAAAAVHELEAERLPAPYREALASIAEGGAAIVESPTGFNVVVSRGRAGGGPVAFEEVEEQLRRQLVQQKAEERFVERLEEEVYVDVRTRPEEVLADLTSG